VNGSQFKANTGCGAGPYTSNGKIGEAMMSTRPNGFFAVHLFGCKKPAADFNQIARRVEDQATGVPPPDPTPRKRPKRKSAHKRDPAADFLGRKVAPLVNP
jgi:hypothetical protein